MSSYILFSLLHGLGGAQGRFFVWSSVVVVNSYFSLCFGSHFINLENFQYILVSMLDASLYLLAEWPSYDILAFCIDFNMLY